MSDEPRIPSAMDRMRTKVAETVADGEAAKKSAQEKLREAAAAREAEVRKSAEESAAQAKAAQDAIETEYSDLKSQLAEINSRNSVILDTLGAISKNKELLKHEVREAIAYARAPGKTDEEEAGKAAARELLAKGTRKEAFASELSRSADLREVAKPHRHESSSLADKRREIEARMQALYPQTLEGQHEKQNLVMNGITSRLNTRQHGVRPSPFYIEDLNATVRDDLPRMGTAGAILTAEMFNRGILARAEEIDGHDTVVRALANAFVKEAIEKKRLPDVYMQDDDGERPYRFGIEHYPHAIPKILTPVVEARIELEARFDKKKKEIMKDPTFSKHQFSSLEQTYSPERVGEEFSKVERHIQADRQNLFSYEKKMIEAFSYSGIRKFKADFTADTSELDAKETRLEGERPALQTAEKLAQEAYTAGKDKKVLEFEKTHRERERTLREAKERAERAVRDKGNEITGVRNEISGLFRAGHRLNEALRSIGLHIEQKPYGSLEEVIGAIKQASDAQRTSLDAQRTRCKELWEEMKADMDTFKAFARKQLTITKEDLKE